MLYKRAQMKKKRKHRGEVNTRLPYGLGGQEDCHILDKEVFKTPKQTLVDRVGRCMRKKGRRQSTDMEERLSEIVGVVVVCHGYSPFHAHYGFKFMKNQDVFIRVGVIFSGYSILQEKLHDAVRFFETCTAKTKLLRKK